MPAAGNEKKNEKTDNQTVGGKKTGTGKNDAEKDGRPSDAELLAILIGSGNTEEGAVALMKSNEHYTLSATTT